MPKDKSGKQHRPEQPRANIDGNTRRYAYNTPPAPVESAKPVPGHKRGPQGRG